MDALSDGNENSLNKNILEDFEMNRRKFFKYSTMGAAVLTASSIVNRYNSVFAKTKLPAGLRPYPHPWMPKTSWAYLTDENEDPFKAEVSVNQDGIIIPENIDKKFSVNTKWFVEGFGYLYLSADNAGEFFTAKDFPVNGNLNYELARTRVARNKRVKNQYQLQRTQFSDEVEFLTSLSEELLEDAQKSLSDGERAAHYSDKALKYALVAGEKIELERARSEIEKQKRMDNVYFGCET